MMGFSLFLIALISFISSCSALHIPMRKQYVSQTAQRRLIQHFAYSEPIINYGNVQYFGDISIGSLNTTVTVLLDTGSSNLWIKGKPCTTDLNAPCSETTDLTNSLTYRDTGIDLDDKYGESIYQTEVRGRYVKDTVSWAGAIATNFQFGVVHHVAGSSMRGLEGAGILGLAFPALSDIDCQPLFHTLVSNKQISSPIFAMNLTSDYSNDGMLSLGITEHFLPNVQWHSVASAKFWSLTGSFTMGKTSFVGTFLIDSGTSNIGVPYGLMKDFFSEFNVDKTGEIKCSEVANLPDIIIGIGWKMYTLSPSEYVHKHFLGCTVAFQRMNAYSKVIILGDTFLSRPGNSVTLFDIGNQRIGLTGGSRRPLLDILSADEFVFVIVALCVSIILIVLYYRRYRSTRHTAFLSNPIAQTPLLPRYESESSTSI